MTVMTEEWAMLWYQCLSENYDYSLYADARIAGNAEVCQKYEQQFDQIADIYSDFGKLRSLDDCSLDPESWWWKEWFEPRQHLFMADVKQLPEPPAAIAPDTMLLSIPLTGAMDETVAAATRAIEGAFSRNNLAGTVIPKYRLLEKDGQPATKIDQVRHAVITSISKWSYIPPPGDGDVVNKISIDFLKRQMHNMGWQLGEREMQDLMQRDYVDPDRQESFAVLIRRHRKLFRALSRNTIRRSFPDTRPLKSTVWDRFKGEQTHS